MMQFTEGDLTEVVRSVWDAMLGLTLLPATQAYETTSDGRYLTGCVQITGSWEGAVMIDLPEALARDAAAAMFGCETADLSDDEVLDALGEIANMVGGNVKGMIDGDCKLSLPTVAEGADFRIAVPGSGVQTLLVFDCAGKPFQVKLLVRQDRTANAASAA
jgi:CheY-specific phosphatase CheX